MNTFDPEKIDPQEIEYKLKQENLNRIKNDFNNQINSKLSMQENIDSDPINTLLQINETLRINIDLSLAIFKLNKNFYSDYILNEYSNLSKPKH